MQETKPTITIKGTRDGLILFIDENSSFEEIVQDLIKKLDESSPKKEEPVVSVKVKLGHRYLTEEQRNQLKKIIEEKNRFQIEAMESEVIPIKDAKTWLDQSKLKVVNQIVRSGQVLETEGDLLLIGDVNPGGRVRARGNIYIMGNLLGIAHAGTEGDQEAFIAASYMKPAQLRIAEYISRAPDYEADGVYMECGIIDPDQNKIVIDSIKILSKQRKVISAFERRMNNG
ncbi:putative septum site-determining protein MinC [Oceanobacillus oncorhynchi subsp. incaldanensis]|uniref:Probable septum site-determining protein MinC n=2 Tax=Oceanobacillus TaxID=182709 RepID=A0A0A1MLF2_9BACI|nr:septum site-determining protein MinC [Oceanobacillus oncorhynchi]MDM8100460.1 septum site-determining protein MinC [Oceanobacillus oncorhynchi]UUI38229.1 septum site-determining protein MinC [Oceanobacillus oncorhynchi]GIO17059.1 putative septum site-determining protein MinC [Oceanobacillus oncorhynchi subsp. incaldanensis]CEI83893.1 Septum site-determining protein MinC [Oceanobacillus oncorhynchi]